MSRLRISLGLVVLIALSFSLLVGDSLRHDVIETSGAKSMGTHYNRLGQEKSPYLLQHKDNPVHWFPWGKEAFEAARAENKIIFLSIGYSTCYWCHVMEKESFELPVVADVMNRHFISIKVDREEHPDVDQIYMDAVVAMTGRGGWPMSVFLTPDLKPFFGGTYFPRERFLDILARVQKAWENDPERIIDVGHKLITLMKKRNAVATSSKLNETVLREAFRNYEKTFDKTYGGFGRAPKFPRSMGLSLLLRMAHRSGNKKALAMATQTLDGMARGGMYDHLGGGFHRYSTDAKWLVPHFEKMLYDNALLAITYLEAYQVTQYEMYAQVAREILDYVLHDMTDPLGGFYSAQDAGEVGREGEYYIWNETEIKKLLTPSEFKKFKKVYGVTRSGNFSAEGGSASGGESHTILNLPKQIPWKQTQTKLVQTARQKLLAVRKDRTPPHKDDKILTSWNGLMIAAMAKGYQVLDAPIYLEAAQSAAKFIQKNLNKDGKLLRRYRDGESKYEGTLNDYAFLIYGLLNLFEADFDPQWVDWAQTLQKKQDALFWDSRAGAYFFSVANDPALLFRKKELDDGALPSGNSIAALNLLRLHDLTFQKSHQKRAQDLFNAVSGRVSQYPTGYAQTLIALDYFLDRSKEIAVVNGDDTEDATAIRRFFQSHFIPNKVLAIGAKDGTAHLPLLQRKEARDGKTTIYICEENLCKRPTHNLKEAARQIDDFERYSL